MTEAVWKAAAVSVAGFSHLSEGTPCQDAHKILCPAGEWIVGVVSDGAGSARFGQIGSSLACEMLATYLAELLIDLHETSGNPPSDAELGSWVEEGIGLLRERLEITAARHAASLSDYHSTVLGVVAGPNGGVFFHIGDGACCALIAGALMTHIVSPPENGEYSDTTYFLTQTDWKAHLRLTRFGPEYDLLIMMTDGVTPFALSRDGRSPFHPFVEPLTRYLSQHSREDGEAAMTATLSKDEIRRITGDDKTLLWAMRTDPHD